MDSNENNYKGGVEDVSFDMNTSDENLLLTIEKWINESKPYHDLMLKDQNQGIRYHHGDQTDKADIPEYNSNTVYNRIWEATETIIPIITGSAHQFIAVPGEENELSLKKAQSLQKVLIKKYEDLEIQKKLENVSRDIILKKFGVIKWDWNYLTDDVDARVVDPRLIFIPKLKMDANDPAFPYVMEPQEYTQDELTDFFPDVKVEDLVKGRLIETKAAQADYSAPVFQVFEITTNWMKVWKQADKILKKIENPYFDFQGETEKVKTTKNGKVREKKYQKFYNHLDYPQKNYIFFNPFTTGDAPVAEVSLFDVSYPIQDDINTQKRQITNNILKMGNGQVYVDSDAMPKELVDSITSEAGLIIEGKNLASENRIRREPGVPLPESHFKNLQDSIIAFDNVFGTHGAVRGESTGGTLGGQIMNRQQDLSRIEMLTRCLNRGVARLADGLVQMMKMFYTEEHVIKILGKDGTITFLSFSRNDIEDGTVINVKSGTPVMLDPIGRHNQAIQLWQLNAIDPETLFERLDFADPQAAAQKLFAWKNNQLVFESQLREKEALAGAEAKAKQEVEKNRDVENPNNVIQRAEKSAASAGGGAPLKNASNGTQGA